MQYNSRMQLHTIPGQQLLHISMETTSSIDQVITETKRIEYFEYLLFNYPAQENNE